MRILWGSLVPVASVFVILMGALPCQAEDGQQGAFEFYLAVQSLDGDTTTATDGLGDTWEFELDNTTLYGLGAGLNFGPADLRGELLFGGSDITGTDLTGGGGMTEMDLDLVSMNLNGDWIILPYAVTPVVTGGIGFINFDGPDFGGVKVSETDFSYNLGAGVRYDGTSGKTRWFIQAMYQSFWTELEDTDDELQLDGISISVGAVF